MKRKVLFSILSAFLLVVVLTGFSPKAVSAEVTATPAPDSPTATMPAPTPTFEVGKGGKVPIGIILPDSYSSIYTKSQNDFFRYLKSLGFSAQILFSNSDTKQEIKNVKKLLDQGIKVLIFCPVDTNNASFPANMAKDAGVPVIAYDRLVSGSDNVKYYVSFGNTAVGEMQAQYLIDHSSGKGIPLYLYAGSSSDNNAFMFFEGAWKVLQPKIADGTFVIVNSSNASNAKGSPVLTQSDIDAIFTQISVSGWNPDEAKKMAKTDLKEASAEQKVNAAILAPNDGTARAISDAFRADKDVKGYMITGQDADAASLQYIRSGRQTMTVFKDTRVLTKTAIEAALSILKGETITTTETINNGSGDIPFLMSGIVTVDKSNIDTAMK